MGVAWSSWKHPCGPRQASPHSQYRPGSMLPLRLPPDLFPVGHPSRTFVLSRLTHNSSLLLIQQVFAERWRVPGGVLNAGTQGRTAAAVALPSWEGDMRIEKSLG